MLKRKWRLPSLPRARASGSEKRLGAKAGSLVPQAPAATVGDRHAERPLTGRAPSGRQHGRGLTGPTGGVPDEEELFARARHGLRRGHGRGAAAKRANRRFRDRPDPGPYLREHRAGRLVRCAQRPVGRAAERHGDRQRLRQRGVRSVPQRRRQPGGAHRHRQQLHHPDLRRGQRRRITGQVRLRLSLWGPTYVP